MRTVRLAAVLDCCCVLAFVIIGRASHVQGTALAFIGVALAFLGLFLLGWRLCWRLCWRLAARRPE